MLVLLQKHVMSYYKRRIKQTSNAFTYFKENRRQALQENKEVFVVNEKCKKGKEEFSGRKDKFLKLNPKLQQKKGN